MLAHVPAGDSSCGGADAVIFCWVRARSFRIPAIVMPAFVGHDGKKKTCYRVRFRRNDVLLRASARNQLMCFIPVIADTRLHLQRNGQVGGAGHQLADLLAGAAGILFRDLEYQFVMDLHDHADIEF